VLVSYILYLRNDCVTAIAVTESREIPALQYGIDMQLHQIGNEVVRMYRSYTQWCEVSVGKIPPVECHDRLRARLHGRSDHVAIVRVRQFDVRYQAFEACH